MSDEDESDLQLQLHQAELERLAKEEGDQLPQGRIYTCDDGTVMEWDFQKKAYFPQPESLTLAIQMLDGEDVRGHKLCVERARFELKGTFDPAKKKKKLINKAKHKYRDTHQM